MYGAGPAARQTNRRARLDVLVPGLSTIVYESRQHIPRSARAPRITLRGPAPAEASRGRMHVRASVAGTSFYEVTFQRRVGSGPWRTVGVDDSAPYQVFDDTTTGLLPGDRVSYRAAVLDNAGHTRGSVVRTVRVPDAEVAISSPDAGDVGDTYPVQLEATVDPQRPLQAVEFERRVGGGPWTSLGVDDSAPAYTWVDDVSDLERGTQVRYRAILTEPHVGPVTSPVTRVTVAAPAPDVDSVTVAGSLQDEIGCPADWQPDCDASHLAFDTGDGLWHGTFEIDAGSYEWKVAIDDSWDLNYGAGGAAGGGNLALEVPEGGARYVFTWDPVTHVPSVADAD